MLVTLSEKEIKTMKETISELSKLNEIDINIINSDAEFNFNLDYKSIQIKINEEGGGMINISENLIVDVFELIYQPTVKTIVGWIIDSAKLFKRLFESKLMFAFEYITRKYFSSSDDNEKTSECDSSEE